MEPILKTIAREYSQRYHNLKNLCFLFPNKRCGVFLRKYFDEYDIHTEDLPHILTISEFMAMASRKYEASRIEQLFALYNSYLEIMKARDKSEAIEFDKFRSWGEIVLSDFNTVDQNLVDPAEIFKNVKDFRELSTDFLSEDQKEVMREYFGFDSYSTHKGFWKNFENEDQLSPLKKSFLNLWQILGPLHHQFINHLEEKGLGTSGSIYRRAYERVNEIGKEIFPYKKIIAVGFNALTESERKIFLKLKDENGYPAFDNFIDFIWDSTGPILSDKNFSASRFIEYNKRHFPGPEWFEKIKTKESYKTFPEIEIFAAPGNIAQTKIAGDILKWYAEGHGRTMLDNSEVALILPDESLLTNMLYSIPDNISEVNLTMSLSFRHTSIATFMSLVRRLYAGMRENKKGKIFYSKDIKMVATHPYSYILFPYREIEDLIQYIDNYHKITLSLDEITSFVSDASVLFQLPSKKKEEKEVFQCLKTLLNMLIEKIELDESFPGEDVSQIKIFKEYVEDLEETLNEYRITVPGISILSMAENLLASEKIGFEGEPLIGLQVMGTLETRSLDFRHLIILSMNEGIMPRKTFTSTFIPESLRTAYGLPPAKYAEEIFAYYFFRLISRAEKVTLIYDSSATSGNKGAESRYLLQLSEFSPEEKILKTAWQYTLKGSDTNNPVIRKTNEIKELIDSFSSDGSDRKNLSASSLNTLRECEVKFFLQYLLNINADPERGDYLDPITIGNILHEVMMELYLPKELQNRLLEYPVSLDKKKLENILNDENKLDSIIKSKVGKLYFKRKEESSDLDESGVTALIAEQIGELAKAIVRHDLTIAEKSPIKLYGCEITKKFKVKLSSGKEVNFRFAIDRLDEIDTENGRKLRIIDYKTGSKKLEAENFEDIFRGGYESSQIFQLFTYAWLLSKMGIKGWEDVVTEIYSVPIFEKGERGLPVIEKTQVESYRPYIETFDQGMNEIIEKLFSGSEFQGPLNKGECEMCGFKDFCMQG